MISLEEVEGRRVMVVESHAPPEGAVEVQTPLETGLSVGGSGMIVSAEAIIAGPQTEDGATAENIMQIDPILAVGAMEEAVRQEAPNLARGKCWGTIQINDDMPKIGVEERSSGDGTLKHANKGFGNGPVCWGNAGLSRQIKDEGSNQTVYGQ